MRLIWGNQMDQLDSTNFVRASVAKKSTMQKIRDSCGKSNGFDVVFAKNFISQYLEAARITVIGHLKELVKNTGFLVCDVPQLAVSREIIYPDSGEHTYLGTRTMSMAEAGALPADLGLLKNSRLTFQTKQVDVVVRREDVTRAKNEVGELVAMSDCEVHRMDESFKLDSPTSHISSIYERAIYRLTLQDQPLGTRVDVQRREWVQGVRNQVEWGCRRIELPLSRSEYEVLEQPCVTSQ